MNEYEWRQQIRVGDEVAISNRTFLPFLERVTSYDDNEIVVGPGRFKKSDGKSISWLAPESCILQPTDEVRVAVDIVRLTNSAKKLIQNITIPTDRMGLIALIVELKKFK